MNFGRERLAHKEYCDTSDGANGEQNNLQWAACSYFWLSGVCVPCGAKKNQGAPQGILLLVMFELSVCFSHFMDLGILNALIFHH